MKKVLLILTICLAPTFAYPEGTPADQDAQRCYEETDLDRAIEYCTKAISSGQMSQHKLAVTYNNRCWAYDKKGKYDLAIADCDAALRLQPDYAKALFNRAHAYTHSGLHDQAIRDFDSAIGLDPNNADAFLDRGNAFLHMEQYARALADFGSAIQLKPNDGAALNDRCYVEAIMGNLVAALADCNRSLQVRSNEGSTLDSRGYVYLRSYDYAHAIADYDVAIRVLPTIGSDSAPSHFGRGVAYKQLGNVDLAEQDFRQALALDPGIETKMNKIGITR